MYFRHMGPDKKGHYDVPQSLKGNLKLLEDSNSQIQSSLPRNHGSPSETDLSTLTSNQLLCGMLSGSTGNARLDNTETNACNRNMITARSTAGSLNSSLVNNAQPNNTDLFQGLGLNLLSFGQQASVMYPSTALQNNVNNPSLTLRADGVSLNASNQLFLEHIQRQSLMRMMASHQSQPSVPQYNIGTRCMASPQRLDFLQLYNLQQLLARQQQAWQPSLQPPIQYHQPNDPNLSLWSNVLANSRNDIKTSQLFQLGVSSEKNDENQTNDVTGSANPVPRKRKASLESAPPTKRSTSKESKQPLKKLKAEQVSKYKGVTWHKRDQKWMSRVWIPKLGRVRYLGTFFTEKEAADAILNEQRKDSLGGDNNQRTQKNRWTRSASAVSSSKLSRSTNSTSLTSTDLSGCSAVNEQDAVFSDDHVAAASRNRKNHVNRAIDCEDDIKSKVEDQEHQRRAAD